ncbi:hypothetical protein [Raineyella sp. W15-4]|uniref:hypothetical protein n=1 Tax=Raineyella sp. W15-4 TaxID=3081651 RepID=UPI0029538615|nr:hypothetical protein [Raineyella sp. W15-4]WOQ16414.1 hypothetical protein R0145_14600 [Raineyella sp. W15-4]
MSKSLGEALSSHDNALNFVRLCLASAVIVSHTIPVAGYGPGWYDRLGSWGDWAVNGFHRLWLSDRGEQTAHRPWRLPLAASAPYPAGLLGEPHPHGVPFRARVDATRRKDLRTAGRLARKHGALVFGTLTVLAMIGLPLATGPLDVTTNLYLHGIRLAAYFCAGMFLFFVRDRISTRWWVAAAALAALVPLSAFGLASAWGQLPYGVLILWLGARLPIQWGARNDISYGIYIYAFAAQQFLAILLGDRLPFVATCLLALALTITLALASWVWVEKPVTRLKNLRLATSPIGFGVTIRRDPGSATARIRPATSVRDPAGDRPSTSDHSQMNEAS